MVQFNTLGKEVSRGAAYGCGIGAAGVVLVNFGFASKYLIEQSKQVGFGEAFKKIGEYSFGTMSGARLFKYSGIAFLALGVIGAGVQVYRKWDNIKKEESQAVKNARTAKKTADEAVTANTAKIAELRTALKEAEGKVTVEAEKAAVTAYKAAADDTARAQEEAKLLSNEGKAFVTAAKNLAAEEAKTTELTAAAKNAEEALKNAIEADKKGNNPNAA